MQPSKGCIDRLQKEYRRLTKEPVPNVTAKPDPGNILEWHFVVEGASGTDYEGGVYHGKLMFPPDYPFKPPGILFTTPNGRFKPHHKICFSFSDYHPEAWNPVWHVATIINATVSFMNEDSNTTGTETCSPTERRQLARASLGNCCKSPQFRKMFPEFVERHAAEAATAQAQAAALSPGAEVPPPADDKPGTHGGQRGDRRWASVEVALSQALHWLPSLVVAALAVSIIVLQLK